MDKDLEKAYMAGLDASVWWQKFVEYLYDTPAGKEMRRELAADFVAWQKQESEFNPRAKVMAWQEMFEKLFPGAGGKGGMASEKQKLEHKQQVRQKAKVRVIELKPKAVGVKIKNESKKENHGPKKSPGSKKKTTTTKINVVKFKNI